MPSNATTAFTIGKAPQVAPVVTIPPKDSPQMGDAKNLWLWFGLLFVNGVGTFGTLIKKKKLNSND